MKRITADGGLTFICPEEFRAMTQEELAQAFANRYRDRIGFRDEEHHIILAVQWRRINVMLASLTTPYSTIRSIRFQMRRLLRNNEYRQLEDFTRVIADREVPAFRYEYRVQGILQEGLVFLLRNGKTIYTIYTYTRSPVTEEARRIIGEILNSASL